MKPTYPGHLLLHLNDCKMPSWRTYYCGGILHTHLMSPHLFWRTNFGVINISHFTDEKPKVLRDLMRHLVNLGGRLDLTLGQPWFPSKFLIFLLYQAAFLVWSSYWFLLTFPTHFPFLSSDPVLEGIGAEDKWWCQGQNQRVWDWSFSDKEDKGCLSLLGLL